MSVRERVLSQIVQIASDAQLEAVVENTARVGDARVMFFREGALGALLMFDVSVIGPPGPLGTSLMLHRIQPAKYADPGMQGAFDLETESGGKAALDAIKGLVLRASRGSG